MPKFIVVFEPKSSTDIHNILNKVQETQEVPEGVEVVVNSMFLVEFPKCSLFFAKLLVALDAGLYNYRFFEVAEAKDSELQRDHDPKLICPAL